MAGNNSTVHIKLTADSADAVKKIAAVEKQATQTASKTEKSFAESGQKLKGHFSGLSNVISNFSESAAAGPAAAAAAIGVSFLAIAKSAISAAEEFDTAHARLQAAVANTGESFSKASKPITESDEKLRALGFTSTETEAAMVPLVNATHNVTKATELMGLAANIARGRNISLGDATTILSKVQLGNYTALRKLGIASKEQIATFKTAADANKALANTFGGQAAAYTTTYAGKIAVLKANLDELKVTLGNALLPTLGEYANALNNTLGAVNHFAGGHNVLGTVVSATSRAVLDFATGGLNEVARHYGLFSSATDHVKNAQKELGDAQKAVAQDNATAGTSARKLADDQGRLDAASAKVKTITDSVATSTDKKTASDKAAGEAIKAHNDSLKNLYDTENSVLDSSLSLDEQNHKLIDTFHKFDDAQKLMIASGGKNNDINEQAIQANYDLQHGIIGAGEAAKKAAEDQQRLANAQHHVATETGVATAGHTAEIGELESLKLTFPKLSPIIDGYINKLGGIQRDITTNVHFNVPDLSVIRTFFPGLSGHRAAGGPVSAGQSYMVGERGPELFTPHTSGSISPNGSGGNNFYISVAGGNPRDTINQIALELRRGGARELQRALGVA